MCNSHINKLKSGVMEGGEGRKGGDGWVGVRRRRRRRATSHFTHIFQHNNM